MRCDAHVGSPLVDVAEEAPAGRGQDQSDARCALQFGLDRAHDFIHRRQAGVLRRGYAHFEFRFVHVGRDIILPDQVHTVGW